MLPVPEAWKETLLIATSVEKKVVSTINLYSP